MHIVQKHIKRWSPYWIALQSLNVLCQLVSIVAAIGAVEGIYQDWCGASLGPCMLLSAPQIDAHVKTSSEGLFLCRAASHMRPSTRSRAEP
jgi:hypothetical protein